MNDTQKMSEGLASDAACLRHILASGNEKLRQDLDMERAAEVVGWLLSENDRLRRIEIQARVAREAMRRAIAPDPAYTNALTMLDEALYAK